MIEPILAAAFAVHNRPGAYAVLVGSGVSSGAGIPTGWAIVEDLIRRLAALEGADVGSDPSAWYEERYGESPTYSALATSLGRTSAERQALVVAYIEPDPATGQRVPTLAHRALARLAAGGWVRVIVTTNFDRLIELALADAGVSPTVLATRGAVAGSLPLAHAGVVVLKVNGDQFDPAIKNTEVELDGYDSETTELLKRIFDEYGLIVCGWSADHDRALAGLIDACPSRRFTTFWGARGELSSRAAALAERRGAEVIRSTDADEFLGRLADACEALRDLDRPHPLTTRVAVVNAKREIAGHRPAISLHDAIQGELTRIRRLPLFAHPLYEGGGRPHSDRLAELEVELELLLGLIGAAAFWGDSSTDRWWVDEIERFAHKPRVSGEVAAIELLRVPALAILWVGGVAAVASHRDDLLFRMLTLPPVESTYRTDRAPAARTLTPRMLSVGDETKRLRRLLRKTFVDHLALDAAVFTDAWERWQYLVVLLGWQARLGGSISQDFVPHIRAESGLDDHAPVPEAWLLAGLARDGPHHVLLRSGLFAWDESRLQGAMQKFHEVFSKETERLDGAALPGDGGVLPSGRHYPGRLDDDPEA